MALPRLLPEQPDDSTLRSDSVLFAVYAPFGGDEVLSTYPEGSSQTLAQHPLVQGLMKVAAQGIHVAALIDRVADDTWLLEIEAGKPAEAKVTSRWKQDMAAPANLAGFLRHAHQSRPSSAIVLALEGHGAGYLPEIDRRQLTLADYCDRRDLEAGVTRLGPLRIERRFTIHHIPTTALRISIEGRARPLLGYSADTAFDPELIEWLAEAELIIHETNFGVHTPLPSLLTLPEALRARMRLIHYPDLLDPDTAPITCLREGQALELG